MDSRMDRLWALEELLAKDADTELRHAHADSAELLEWAVLQLSRGHWKSPRISMILDRYRQHGLAEAEIPNVLRLAYQNRVADRTAGDWANVESLGFPPEVLLLNHEQESGYLGQVLSGHYRLERRIAKGSVAVVYQATDLRDATRVAIKMPADVRNLEFSRRLLAREAEVSRRIDHPSVPAVVASDFIGEQPFLAITYVEGKTLAAFVAGQPQTTVRSRAIALCILDPLEIAHDLGIFHRDISPYNILVDDECAVYLMDWNGSLNESEMSARDGEYGGTPGYASQEALYGLTHRIDVRSDLWSVGAILYELLTGLRPQMVRDRESAVVSSAVFDPAQLAFPDTVTDSLKKICLKALHPNSALRYGSVAEFRAALLGQDEELKAIRRTRAFEMGCLFGEVRLSWLLFTQMVREAGAFAEKDRRKIQKYHDGISHMILADQKYLEASEIAATFGIPIDVEAVPGWLMNVIYRPNNSPSDLLEKMSAFAAGYDQKQSHVQKETKSALQEPGHRLLFEIGFLCRLLRKEPMREFLKSLPLDSCSLDDGARFAPLVYEQVLAVGDQDLPTRFQRRMLELLRQPRLGQVMPE
jgi:serine/threonine protein kinase